MLIYNNKAKRTFTALAFYAKNDHPKGKCNESGR